MKTDDFSPMHTARSAVIVSIVLLLTSCGSGTSEATDAAARVCTGERPAAGEGSPMAAESGPAFEGYTLYMGSNGFAVGVPAGWVVGPASGHEEQYSTPDLLKQLAIANGQLDADVVPADWAKERVTEFNERFSTQPESSEPTSLDGAAATLRTYHITEHGNRWYALRIVCARAGVGTVFQWLSLPGHEQADRALFEEIRGTFHQTGASG